MSTQKNRCRAAIAVVLSYNSMSMASAFSNPQSSPFGVTRASQATTSASFSSQFQPHNNNDRPRFGMPSPLFAKFEKMDEDDDQVFAFMETSGERGIDCYIDSYATVDGVEYAIGSPCDYAVALCYFEGDEQLVPIELEDPLMEEIFPIAEGIIEEEFGEELVLLRTPQTLTLVGELEESDLEEDDNLAGDINETEEEVEILVSFEEDGQEYHLVRLLDPVLLVGKAGNENTRILLTPEESDNVMPKLEDMFLTYQEGDEM
mmetsp:Transcript_22351/g.40292  ORF Transcript_22351/g.40292 Transcript_22351/m.40292 type:complete len:261 (+) Transcript_22351:149-931(+)